MQKNTLIKLEHYIYEFDYDYRLEMVDKSKGLSAKLASTVDTINITEKHVSYMKTHFENRVFRGVGRIGVRAFYGD